MSALYLEHYLDSIETLPGELQKNFEKLLELNIKTKCIMQESEIVRRDLLQNIKTLSKEEIEERQTLLRKKFDVANKLADEKIKHANKTYELVDKHIRRLDADLSRFDGHKKYVSNEAIVEELASRKRKRKSTKEIEKKKKEEVPNVAVETKPPKTEVLNMPVDPNEPTFCLCNQVSYGQMIGCDNSDCVIEWFHFNCVDLKVKPKGQWFCPDCSKEKKKK